MTSKNLKKIFTVIVINSAQRKLYRKQWFIIAFEYIRKQYLTRRVESFHPLHPAFFISNFKNILLKIILKHYQCKILSFQTNGMLFIYIAGDFMTKILSKFLTSKLLIAIQLDSALFSNNMSNNSPKLQEYPYWFNIEIWCDF